MDNDDKPTGTIVSRKEALKMLGLTAGTFLLAACSPQELAATLAAATEAPSATNTTASNTGAASPAAATRLPACVVRPEMTEGPYYVDADFNRQDIRSDPASGAMSEGALLTLSFVVSQISNESCLPLEGAKVESWHCDADGVYSGVQDPGFDTSAMKFLRGYQETDANGMATFKTVYPGWYPGRTVHIHFKVWHERGGQTFEFTSQLFFDDTLSDVVLDQPPYNARGYRSTLNQNDRIYNDALLVDVAADGDGYVGVFDIGLMN